MADIDVSMTIQNLELLQEESVLTTFRPKITHIIDALNKTKAILKYPGGEERIKRWSQYFPWEQWGNWLQWFEGLRDVAFKTEDFLEDYMFQHRTQPLPFRGFGIPGFIHSIKHFFNKLYSYLDLQYIKVKIEDIPKTMNEPTVNESTVAVLDPVNRIIRKLIEEPVDSRLTLVRVEGQLARYNTVVVKKVYENERVRAEFPILCWVKGGPIRDVIRDLILATHGSLEEEEKQEDSELYHQLNDMQEVEELKEMLENQLRNKRFLIVVDSFRRFSTTDWNEVKSALPDDNCASRIILNTELDYHKFSMMTVLVGISDWPCHLKACLLYLCLFPENYVIPRSKLLRLWAAEGFCCLETRNNTMSLTKEQVAKHYLDELIEMGFIKEQDIDLYGRPRTCCIQFGSMRQMIIKRARSKIFAELSTDLEGYSNSVRHLAIVKNDDSSLFDSSTRLSQLQSFFADGESSLFDSSAISIFTSRKIKFLKVLDLEGSPLKEFPGELLTNLYFLRYLAINSETFSLPSYLGRLVYLETLVLKGLFSFKLPDEILQLKRLRILLGDLLELPKGIGGMTKLEKLNLVVGYEGIESELCKLTRLRSLCIVQVMNQGKGFMLSSLESMIDLRTLYLRSSCPKDSILEVRNFPPLLQSLTLVGRMDTVPVQILSLKNLSQLKLSYSRVPDYAFFEGLQRLPKLMELVLEMGAIIVPELHFRMGRGSFPKLITLELHGLSELKQITVEEGAMPCIEIIRFIDCPLVKNVPVGIEHLRTLKKIDLAMMASNLEGKLRSHCLKAGLSPTVKSFVDEYEIDSSTSLVDELDMEF